LSRVVAEDAVVDTLVAVWMGIVYGRQDGP
jgi:hypothetical protein